MSNRSRRLVFLDASLYDQEVDDAKLSTLRLGESPLAPSTAAAALNLGLALRRWRFAAHTTGSGSKIYEESHDAYLKAMHALMDEVHGELGIRSH